MVEPCFRGWFLALVVGTGFMQSLSDAIHNLSEYGGYTENLSAKEDHFECDSGKFKLYPSDFMVEKVFRFENSSDPDDNAILYAISDCNQKIRGLYVESYGRNQEALSKEMTEKLKMHADEDIY